MGGPGELQPGGGAELLPGEDASSLCPYAGRLYFFILLFQKYQKNRPGGDMTETETPTSLITYIYTSARTSARGEGGFRKQGKNQIPGAKI